MKDNNNIIERIKNQKEAFINWDKELKNLLLSENPKNQTRKLKFYIVKIDWLEKYKQIELEKMKISEQHIWY